MVNGYTPQTQSVNPFLHKRTSDGAFVELRWTVAGFRAPDGTVIPLNSWYEYDGSRYAVVTEAAKEGNYTPAGNGRKLQYR